MTTGTNEKTGYPDERNLTGWTADTLRMRRSADQKDTGSKETEWGEFWLYLPISDIPLLGGLGKQIIRSGVIEYNHVENPNTTHAGTAHIVYTTPPLLTSVDSYNLMTTRLD